MVMFELFCQKLWRIDISVRFVQSVAVRVGGYDGQSVLLCHLGLLTFRCVIRCVKVS